jgi:hypothetical protein
MSWRFIIAVLLVAAGASAWGGLRLGDWLIAHGPENAEVHNEPPVSTVPVLDANGLPFVAVPPQPLVDGHLAVPDKIPPITWEIPQQSVASNPNPTVALATTPITMDQAKQIAATGSSNPGLVGIADVGNLGLEGGAAAKQPIQPVEMPAPPPPPSPTATAESNKNWQASFHQAMQTCSAQSFFDRPSCAWAARNKYCGPNNAWGKVRDCPAKTF